MVWTPSLLALSNSKQWVGAIRLLETIARPSHDPPLLPHYPLGSAMWGRGRKLRSLLLCPLSHEGSGIWPHHGEVPVLKQRLLDERNTSSGRAALLRGLTDVTHLQW